MQLALNRSLVILALLAGVVRGGEWRAWPTEKVAPVLTHEGERLLGADHLFWGENFKWAGINLGLGEAQPQGMAFSGAVKDLGLTIAGTIAWSQPHVLRYTYHIEAARDLRNITGGGVEFRLKLNAGSLAAPMGQPVLLENNTGWRWDLGKDQEISVRFDPPLAGVYFERGNRGQIRAMFLAGDVPAGKRSFAMELRLPAGTQILPPLSQRYGQPQTSRWYRDALAWDASPVDLRFLNEKPAGRRGFVSAQGERLVFEDGTPARFWGGNIAAYAIANGSKEQIQAEARRIAKLGYNLMRIHHHDSSWVSPIVIDTKRDDTQQLDRQAMDKLDWWIKCLKEEGVYVWLDLHVGRAFKAGDGIAEGFEEIERQKGQIKGFCFFNPRVQELMKDFNRKYLNHYNPYTQKAYKDEPAIMGVLLSNENDLTHHFGNLMLADKGNPVHNRLFNTALRSFSLRTGLGPGPLGQTWVPGPSKLFLNDQEHRFNQILLEDLRQMGLRVPVATGHLWGDMPLYSLPALTDGGVIDAHSYGTAEALSVNPRYEANFVAVLAATQLHGRPMTITEWNVPYPAVDRFTAPLYLMSIACLQGWDAPMIYNYSQSPLVAPTREDTWSTARDAGLSALMPAAAVAFRQQHVSEAKESYCLKLNREQTYYTALDAHKSAAIRTLCERSKLSIGLPAVKELPWVQQSVPGPGVKVIEDPYRDWIPAGQRYVESDTGELRRDWGEGIQTINTPMTQAASGWIGGKAIELADVAMKFSTPKATVVVSSLDGQPIQQSRRALITLTARVMASPGGKFPMLSEPVAGALSLRSKVKGLKLLPLTGKGLALKHVPLKEEGGLYTLEFPVPRGTHWFLLWSEEKGGE